MEAQPNNGRREKLARSRGASSSDVPRKHQRAGEKKSRGDRRDEPGSPDAPEALRATRIAHERHGSGDVLHSFPTKRERDIVKEMLAIGRLHSNLVETHPDQESGRPHIWFFNSMLTAAEIILRSRFGEQSPPDQGKTESSEAAQDDNRKLGSARTGHVDKSMHALPNHRKAWETRQGADHFLQSND